MPLSAKIIIEDVSLSDSMVTVAARLVLSDGAQVVLNRVFHAKFRPDLDGGVKENIEDVLLKKMQKAVDEYKGSVDMRNNPKVQVLKSNIESRIVL